EECKTIVVDKYQITITANDKTKVYGAPDPSPLDFTVTGLQGSDTLTTQPTCHLPVGYDGGVAGSPWTIHCTGATVADPSKYDINYVDGHLTVMPAASVVTGPTLHKTFGGPDPTTITPTASNGAPVPTGVSCTIADPHVNVPGPYDITCTGPQAQGNY